ncbi:MULTISPECIES: hypothetical protein [Gammaproteobacteria]|jgi:hypothetical protein
MKKKMFSKMISIEGTRGREVFGNNLALKKPGDNKPGFGGFS